MRVHFRYSGHGSQKLDRLELVFFYLLADIFVLYLLLLSCTHCLTLVLQNAQVLIDNLDVFYSFSTFYFSESAIACLSNSG